MCVCVVAGNNGQPGIRGLQGLPGQPGTPGSFGDPGPKGPLGPTGLDGNTGYTGQQGMVGDRGTPGATGATGDPGPTGPGGVLGPRGATGQPGDIGDPGRRGLAGEPGPQGQRGATGPSGSQGDKGATGMSIYTPLSLCVVVILLLTHCGWLGSRVVSVLDSCAVGPGFKSVGISKEWCKVDTPLLHTTNGKYHMACRFMSFPVTLDDLEVIRLLPDLSNAIRRPFTRHFAQFQLTRHLFPYRVSGSTLTVVGRSQLLA